MPDLPVPDLPPHFPLVLAVFLLAGLVKGVIGLGLPTVAMGLLGLAMPPAQAAALLVVPSLVTNVWQLLAGPRFGALTRRLWPMLLGVGAGTSAGSGVLTGGGAGRATAALGRPVSFAAVHVTPGKWLLLTAQTSRAAADHGLLPQLFARTRAGDTPVAGLMTAGIAGTVGVLITISPTLGQQFGLLSEAATLFCLLMYLASCAAAIARRPFKF